MKTKLLFLSIFITTWGPFGCTEFAGASNAPKKIHVQSALLIKQ